MAGMTTLQTTSPIRRMTMQTTNRPAGWLIGLADRDPHGLDMDQPYQRGLVWGETRRRLLIQSLLEGVPVPSLIINDRFTAAERAPGGVLGQREFDDREGGRNWAYAIVDGKQRASTILAFMRGQLTVPASWFSPADVDPEAIEQTDDGPYVRWAGLSQRMKRFFDNSPIGVCEGRFATMAEEREIFNRVNFGGVAQGDSDL